MFCILRVCLPVYFQWDSSPAGICEDCAQMVCAENVVFYPFFFVVVTIVHCRENLVY